jgi:uncharacterized iron-regulated protein
MLPRYTLFTACTLTLALAACATPQPQPTTPARLQALGPAELLLLGEQHDAPEHQQIHAEVVQALAQQGRLAALALEMADAGASTAGLPRNASPDAVQKALQWNDKGWPWQHYGPAVMAAVQAGVPVFGANLPRARMREAMADATLDTRLPPPALLAQQDAIRTGHCMLLPETQTLPMARIQVAKDLSMARTLAQAVQPGKVVVLMACAGHVERSLGVPVHLPSTLAYQAVRLRAGGARPEDKLQQFHAIWETPAVPPKDYCAGVIPKRNP